MIALSQSEFEAALGLLVGFDKKVKSKLYSFLPSEEVLTECIDEAMHLVGSHSAKCLPLHLGMTFDGTAESTQSPTVN